MGFNFNDTRYLLFSVLLACSLIQGAHAANLDELPLDLKNKIFTEHGLTHKDVVRAAVASKDLNKLPEAKGRIKTYTKQVRKAKSVQPFTQCLSVISVMSLALLIT